jgi:hypothetical protein
MANVLTTTDRASIISLTRGSLLMGFKWYSAQFKTGGKNESDKSKRPESPEGEEIPVTFHREISTSLILET